MKSVCHAVSIIALQHSKMIELLITLLVVGFILYYLVRHPIKTFKFTIATLGLLLLGALGTFGFFYILIA